MEDIVVERRQMEGRERVRERENESRWEKGIKRDEERKGKILMERERGGRKKEIVNESGRAKGEKEQGREWVGEGSLLIYDLQKEAVYP